MRLFRAGDSEPIAATLDNISGGGLFFTTAMPVSDGERLTCQILLPVKTSPLGEAALLECELVAVRVQSGATGYGIGCQFSHYCVQLPRRDIAYWVDSFDGLVNAD
jgi:hypothetical protein